MSGRATLEKRKRKQKNKISGVWSLLPKTHDGHSAFSAKAKKKLNSG